MLMLTLTPLEMGFLRRSCASTFPPGRPPSLGMTSPHLLKWKVNLYIKLGAF